MSTSGFDLVLMCNVFHELTPTQWYEYLVKPGAIFSHLSSDGYFLIVEDQFLPVGEKANHFGFLLFGSKQFKDLFKITDKDIDYLESSYDEDDRLKAYLIPKKYLDRVDANSIKSALESLHKESLEHIHTIRKSSEESMNYKIARKYAMWAQLYANAKLALDDGKGTSLPVGNCILFSNKTACAKNYSLLRRHPKKRNSLHHFLRYDGMLRFTSPECIICF